MDCWSLSGASNCPLCRVQISIGVNTSKRRENLLELLQKRVTKNFVKNNKEVLDKLRKSLYEVAGIKPTELIKNDNSHFSLLCNMLVKVEKLN